MTLNFKACSKEYEPEFGNITSGAYGIFVREKFQEAGSVLAVCRLYWKEKSPRDGAQQYMNVRKIPES
jgi:hypothetical protein